MINNMNHTVKYIVVQILSFIVLLSSMLLGIFGAAGFCALVWGSNILDNELGENPERLHPAFITLMLLSIPGMLIGAIGAIFGIILPLHFKFKVKLGKCNKGLVKLLDRYVECLKKLLEENAKNGTEPTNKE